MRYVLVGSGNIAKTWALALQRTGDELVACVSRSGSRPLNAPADLPVFATITAVTLPFDTVILTTPNGLHREGGVEAAERGKHLLTEKPLEIDRAEAQTLIDAHQRAGTVLGVSFQRRTRPDNLALKKLFAEKAFGRIIGADLSCRFWRDKAYFDSGAWRGGWEIDGGGPFMQQAIHNLDLYLWFFGSPEQVTGHTGTFLHDIDVEDHGAAVFRHADGMIGTVVASTCARPGSPARLEVTTERGCFTTLDDKIALWDIEGIPNPSVSSAPASGNTASVSDTSGFEAILKDFGDAVATGRPPLIPGAEAALATDLVLRIYGR